MAVIGKEISRARAILERSDLVAIPTETVYGLAGNCLDSKAIANIFEIKHRPYFDPLIAHFADIEQVKKYVLDLPEKAEVLAKKFWPGPLTMILRKKEMIPDIATSGLDTVAVRIPNHPLTLELLKNLDFPVAAPSANPFGYVSPTTAFHVQAQLGERIDYILDGGPCKVGIESTILGFDGDQTFVHRLGGISLEQITSVIGNVEMAAVSEKPAGPGMLESHYAPNTPIRIGNIEQLLTENNGHKVGVLAFNKYYLARENDNQVVLSEVGDVVEAATKLFSGLRYLDEAGLDLIVSEYVPESGLGRAINDRLNRASAKRK